MSFNSESIICPNIRKTFIYKVSQSSIHSHSCRKQVYLHLKQVPHLKKLFENNKLQFYSVHADSLSSITKDCVISIKMDTTIRSVWNYGYGQTAFASDLNLIFFSLICNPYMICFWQCEQHKSHWIWHFWIGIRPLLNVVLNRIRIWSFLMRPQSEQPGCI